MHAINRPIIPLILCAAMFVTASLHGTQLTWDADPTTASPQDGAGVWDTTTNTWWDGAANVVWNNATPDSAVFGAGSGPAGVVSNSLPVTVGNITFNATGSGTYTLNSSAANTVTLSGNPTITANVNAALNVVLAGTSFTKEGSGQLSLRPAANNTYAGTTIVNNGILALNSSTGSRVLIPGDLTVNSGATVTNTGSANAIASAATVTVNANATFNANAAGGSSAFAALILNGGTVLQNGTETLIVPTVDARAGSLLQASGATGKLDGNLTKSTAGTVTITARGSSATTGGLTNTVVNGGTLIFDYVQASKLNDGGTVTVNSGTLLFTNYASADTVGSVVLAGGVITNTSGTTDLRLPSGGNFDVRSGEIYVALGSGAGRALTKSTSGTVILGADNIYSGGTLISGGILQLGNGGTAGNAGTTSANITNNSQLVLNRSDAALSLGGVINGSGSITKLGSGTVALTGANTYQGSTTISNGAISLNSSSTLGDGTGTLNLSGGTLNTSAGRSVSTAPVANPVNLTADSSITTSSTAATVDLSFTNDIIGGSAGTLTFRNDGADAAADQFEPRFTGNFTFGRPIVIDNGALGKTRLSAFNTNGTTQTFNGVLSGNGSFRRSVTAGTGGVTVLNATNTYSGATAVNAGTLLVNGALGGGNVTITSGGVLGGNGTINGAVTNQSGGTVSAGTSIGILTISNALTFLNNSTNLVEINKTAGTNDLIRGLTTVTYGGTLVVVNLSGTLAANDSFKLFSAATYTGNFASSNLPALGGGLAWDTSGLSVNGTLKVTTAAATSPQIGSVALSSTNLILTGTGGTAGADYWVLTATNLTQPRANWTSIATNQFITGGNFNFTNAVDPLKPTLFYLLQVP